MFTKNMIAKKEFCTKGKALLLLKGSSAYRDNTEGAKAYLSSLLEKRQKEINKLPQKFTKLYSKRLARIGAGFVALLGFLALVFVLVFLPISLHSGEAEIPEIRIFFLLFPVFLSFLFYIFLQNFADYQLKTIWKKYFQRSNDVFVDIEKFSNVPPREFLQEKLKKLEAKVSRFR